MAGGVDAFTQLALEHERTLFMFYGFTNPDGTRGGAYFKLAHSLSEALADLEGNGGVAHPPGGYLVSDAFLEAGEEADEPPTVHVELVSVESILAGAEGGE